MSVEAQLSADILRDARLVPKRLVPQVKALLIKTRRSRFPLDIAAATKPWLNKFGVTVSRYLVSDVKALRLRSYDAVANT